MREPATLWDLGLSRLDLDLRLKSSDFAIDGAPPSGIRSEYKREANRLAINLIYNKPRFADLEKAKQACREVVASLRSFFLVDSTTGVPLLRATTGGGSSLAGYFTHGYFDAGREPKDFENQLDGILVLNTVLMSTGGSALTCSAPLLGRTVTYDK